LWGCCYWLGCAEENYDLLLYQLKILERAACGGVVVLDKGFCF